jgi:adenylate cyclase class 2
LTQDRSIVETELKYLGADLDAVRARLSVAGATLVAARELETNSVFDDAEESLRSTGRLLRLRNGHELTVKLPLEPGRFKSQREITAGVTEGSIEELLAGLGYQVVFRYEKYREYWDLDGATVTLDNLPFLGPVIEIEGEAETIDAAASRLELDGVPTSTENYLSLFQQHARAHNLPEGTFMTFEAEKSLSR